MIGFQYYNPTKIIFGENCYEDIGKTVANYSKRILLHYGGKSLKGNGTYNLICKSLKAAGIQYFELGGVCANPRLSLVKEGIALCRKENIKFILAAGGGSVIDSAKAIAVGVDYEGDVWDFYTKGIVPKEVLDIGVILTIPAAGSESSDGSVITNEAGPDKKSFCSERLFPKFAFLNPSVCKTLPEFQIASGGADILSHIMERYFTCTENTDLSDRLCEAAMQSLLVNLPKVLKDRSDGKAWSEVMWIGNVAHNSLLGKGRKEDWACHAIEHEISAIYDIAHGAGLAIVYPAWMKYCYQDNISRFVQFAERVWNIDTNKKESNEIALEAIQCTEKFLKRIGLTTRLSENSIDTSDFEAMAKKACGENTIGSLKQLDAKDVYCILEMAF